MHTHIYYYIYYLWTEQIIVHREITMTMFMNRNWTSLLFHIEGSNMDIWDPK